MTHTLKQQVKRILLWNPETRNSDTLLTLEVWKQFHDARFPISQETFLKLMREASQDNVKRIRAWFNQAPRYQFLPTDPKVARARGLKRETWERYMKFGIYSDNPPKVEQPQRKILQPVSQGKLI